jgi:hypothetical protein
MDTDTEYGTLLIKLADPGWLSWIPDPDFYPFPIPDLGSNNSTKRGRGKTIFVVSFLKPQIS